MSLHAITQDNSIDGTSFRKYRASPGSILVSRTEISQHTAIFRMLSAKLAVLFLPYN